MKPNVLRNLTLASAKHLVTQGHISGGQHKKIMKSVAAPAMAANKPPSAMKAGAMQAPPMSQEQLEAPVPMGRLDAVQGRGSAPMLPLGDE